MILKLEAAKRALEGGVRQVRIVGGNKTPDALLLAFHSAEHATEDHSLLIPGTRVLRESFPKRPNGSFAA